MWRALVVDDEEWVRSYLISLFAWSEFEFAMPLEAENGIQAIALIESEHPDAVITDIRMPEKDGLELTAWIQKNTPDTPVIILSAYNDFSYVREALRLGARDYLIKAEAAAESANRLLRRIGEILNQREDEKVRRHEMANAAVHYRNQAYASFWRDLLTGVAATDELTIQERSLNISIRDTLFALLMVHVKQNDTGATPASSWESFFQENLAAIFPNHCQWWLIRFRRGNWVVLTAKPADWTEAAMLKLIEEAAFQIAQTAAGRLVSCNASGCYPASELPKAFSLVQEINLLRLYQTEDGYISHQKLLKIQQAPAPQTGELLTEWERNVRTKDSDRIQGFLTELFERTIPAVMPPGKARLLVLDMIGVLRKISLARRILWEQIDPEQIEPLETLEKMESCAAWREWLAGLVAAFLLLCKKQDELPASQIIQKALDYIQTNLGRDLSLSEVADHAGISKCHLSRIFPEYVGEHFGSYIQRLKLEKAKELLRLTNLRIYQVAEKVGYDNIRYFSRIFRDAAGVTPADFRRLNR